MKKWSMFCVRCSVLVAVLLLCAATVSADGNEADAPAATSAELETKYRAELEKRLAQERESYKGSLRSLWMANAAVWACLLAFIAMQAISARKRAAELARLKSDRNSDRDKEN